LLIENLDIELYGFWSLLWIIFGYSLLLDFGFGMSIQKESAILSERKDLKTYNEHLSTVFLSYTIISLVIIAFTFLLSKNIHFILDESTSLPLQKLYASYVLEFGILTAIIFPTGIFKEILTGLNRIDLRNYLFLSYEVLNFILISSIFLFDMPFEFLVRGSLGLCLLVNILFYFFAKRITGMKIRFSFFKIRMVKEITQFSASAYLIMCSNLIILKTDQITLSLMGTLTFVGYYQIASRLPFLFKTLAEQMQENLVPLTARLFSVKNHSKLNEVFILSTRINIFISTCGFIIFMIYLKPFLLYWLKVSTPEIINASYLLIISTYIIILGKSVNANMLLMVNQHNYLSKLSLYEAGVNLILTICLIPYFGILGAAIGTIIPQTIISFAFITPRALRFFKANLFKDFISYLLRAIFCSLWPFIITTLISPHLYPSDLVSTLLHMITFGFGFLISGYFIYLSSREKEMLKILVFKKNQVPNN
jgi:O-antigen/teichoic acid export membrane protein